MNTKKNFLIALCMPLLLLLSSCFPDEVDNIFDVIIADLGGDQTAAIGDVVTIDFSASTAPVDAQYTLSYQNGPLDSSGNFDIVDQNGSSFILGTLLITVDKNQTFSFVPDRNGTYVFQVNVFSNNGGNDIDEINVVVSGAVVLTTSSFSSSLVLSDQNSGSLFSGADYIINEVVEVTSSLEIGANVDIEFGTNGGLIVNGGTVYNTSGGNANLFGDSGWKGILLKAGILNLSNSFITNAGATAFTGYDQAAIIVESGALGLSANTFQGTTGINVNFFDAGFIDSSIGFVSNTFDASDAIHCDFFQLTSMGFNSFGGVDPLITVTGAGDTFLNTGAGSFIINGGEANFYFKGGASFGQFVQIQLNNGKTIYFESDTGITFSAGVNINGDVSTGAGSSTLKGWNDAGWKGIYVGSSNNSFSNIVIDGAGSSANSSSFGVAAAIYNSGVIESMSRVTVSNSASYGLYQSGFSSVLSNHSYQNLTFTNNASAAIVAPSDFASAMLEFGTFTFNTLTDVEAIRLLSRNSSSASVSLVGLGVANYYLAEDNMVFSGSGSLNMASGTHVKFMTGTSVYFGPSSTGSFNITGTAADPVLLEGSDAAGGWDGVYIGSTSSVTYNFDNVAIRDGGANLLSGATESANLILRSSTATYSFTNCTISDSKGWGVVLESFSSFYDFLAVANNNTFLNNTSGDVNDKTP